MQTFLLAALCLPTLSVAAQDPLPRWDEATLVIGDKQLALTRRAASPEREVTLEAPSGWTDADARLVSLLPLGGAAQLSVALVRRASALELCGGPNSGAPQWRIALESLAPLAEEQAFLLAPRHPERTAGELALLARCGGDVLALSGSRGHLVRVDPTSGAVRARLDAPWELQRGFIGPSVWQVQLQRFGSNDLRFEDLSAEQLAAQRRHFEQRVVGSLVGGPLVSGERVYLAVAHAAPGDWVAQRADVSILELSDMLDPISLTPLPANTAPAAVAAPGGGVVWALNGGGFANLAATSSAEHYAMGPGSFARRANVRWLHGAPLELPSFFLLMDRPADPVVFTGAIALRTGRPYVPKAASAELRLPLEVTALASGQRARAELRAPLSSAPTAPTTNYMGHGDGAFELLGARIAGVTALDIVETKSAARGERLVLTVMDASGSHELHAPEGALEALAASAQR